MYRIRFFVVSLVLIVSCSNPSINKKTTLMCLHEDLNCFHSYEKLKKEFNDVRVKKIDSINEVEGEKDNLLYVSISDNALNYTSSLTQYFNINKTNQSIEDFRISCSSGILNDEDLRIINGYNGSKNLILLINEDRYFTIPFSINEKIKIYNSREKKDIDKIRMQFIKDEILVKKVLKHKTFLISGNSVEKFGEKTILNIGSHINVIKHNVTKRDRYISVIFDNQFFQDCGSADCNIKKLEFFKKDISKLNLISNFYIPKNIYNESHDLFDKISKPSPDFNSIIYAKYKGHKNGVIGVSCFKKN
jgi:hypothetical protein